MPIDLQKALGAPPEVQEIAWTGRDVLLYHLSLGAGARETLGPELPFTYERDLAVLPAFALVAGSGISSGEAVPPGLDLAGIDVDLRRVLHAGQSLTAHRPLPTAGRATVTSRVTDVWDKGKAAVIVRESGAHTQDGEPLWTTSMQIWVRGEGGFGGEAGPDTPWELPDRPADMELDLPTGPQQALLYRLNGDLNPLHADPRFARSAGLDRPVLHGLATYGIACKAVVDGLLDGDVTRLTGFGARFAGTLYPGETLRVRAWRDGGRIVLAATCPERGDAPVLSHAFAEATA